MHNAQKPTQRVKENEEMGICSQQKNEIKPQEKILNAIEINVLPDKGIQNNGHKNAHLAQKKNG